MAVAQPPTQTNFGLRNFSKAITGELSVKHHMVNSVTINGMDYANKKINQTTMKHSFPKRKAINMVDQTTNQSTNGGWPRYALICHDDDVAFEPVA
ncbi:hypothetical protein ACTXT7_000053 [Hymenolepis weldensis]